MSNNMAAGDLNAAIEAKWRARQGEADAYARGLIRVMWGRFGYDDYKTISKDGKHIFNPYAPADQQAVATVNDMSHTLVDPFETYGKEFCTSPLVGMVMAYLDKTQPPVAKGPHPLYPRR